jgi:hypothetical protein
MVRSDDVPRPLLATIDALALAAFVLVGVRSHHDAEGLRLLARNAVPLEASWFVVAALFGAYRRPGIRTLLATWAVAVPTGLLVRSAWIGSPAGARLLLFLGVGLVFTLLFLLVGRALAAMIARRVLPAGRRT